MATQMANRDHGHYTGWGPLIPLACAGIVGVNLVAAVLQERMNGYSLTAGIIAAAIVWTPFALDVVGSFRTWYGPTRVDPIDPGSESFAWLMFFPVPVLVGMAYLLWHPADTDFAPFVLVFMNGELVARSAHRTIVAVLPAVGALGLMVAAEAVGPWMDGSFIWIVGITFGWIGGFLIRQLETRGNELEAAQTELAAKAAADERSRIAREVHDVIAHSLSVTMLHTSAARMALEKGKITDALEALREAEKQGRSSLGEVRRTVGLLGPDESATAAPMPGIEDLPRLAADFRTAGLDVTMKIDADPPIPAAAGLNVYRVVQEALTNAAKHSPGAPVDVQVRICDEGMHVRVHNPPVNGVRPSTSGKGLGLRGMSERAAVLGGALDTDDSDGWTVTLTAPRPA